MIGRKNVLRGVGRDLGYASQICQDLLILHPITHILRGFCFEATGRRGRFFLWKIIMPLYRERADLVLNYSIRLEGRDGFEFDFDARSRDDIQRDIISAIRSGHHMDTLDDVQTPEGFLRYLENMGIRESNDFKRLLDFGLTLALCNRHEDAREVLTRLLDFEDPQGWYVGLRLDIAEIINSLAVEPFAVVEKIAAWEKACMTNILRNCTPV